MTNWYENNLSIISKNKEQLQEFIEKVSDPDENRELSFNKLVPCPIELLDKEVKDFDLFPDKRDELLMKYGYEDCDSWRLGNWSTKWDVEETTKKVFDYEVFYSFKTACSPPVHWLVKMVLMFPYLEFQLKYEEPSTGSMGELTASAAK